MTGHDRPDTPVLIDSGTPYQGSPVELSLGSTTLTGDISGRFQPIWLKFGHEPDQAMLSLFSEARSPESSWDTV